MEPSQPDDEAPLLKELRRAHAINMRLLQEKEARDRAVFESRKKRWIWKTWWTIEWWLKDLFREAISKRPKITPPIPSNAPSKNPDSGWLGIFFCGGLGVLLFVFQANGVVEIKWAQSAFIYVIVIAVMIWSLLTHGIPHKSRAVRCVIICVAAGLLISLGTYGTQKQYQREHSAQITGDKAVSVPPNIRIILMGAEAKISQQSDPPLTIFRIAVKVVNSGGSLILTDWRIEAKLRDGRVLKNSPSARSLGLPSTLPSGDWLDLAANNVEIKTGNIVQGELVFSFNVTNDEINTSETVLTLSATDLAGQRYQGSQRLGDWSVQK